ncbi:MAG TPA: hypothetical protein VJ890_17110 [Vineibacter sp.]|nr:hypothetical protein [Vineibacter sp.]
MRKFGSSLVLFLALNAGISWAQWHEDGKILPDVAWRKSVGTFGAMLMLTDDPKNFFEQWSRPPAPDYKPRITTVTETRRGGRVAALVFFVGCQPDKSGNCDVDADYQLFRPDGSVYGGQKNIELSRGKAAPVPNIQVGVRVFELRVEPEDPFGTYTFEARVRDRNANVEMVLTQELTVVR